MYNEFHKDLEYGKSAERLVKESLVDEGFEVIDVGDIKEYQKKDIDLLCIDPLTDKEIAFEIKDATNTINSKHNTVPVEFFSFYDGTDPCFGWLWRTKADYIVFVDRKNRLYYQIGTDDLKTLILDYYSRKNQGDAYLFDDDYKRTLIYNVPLKGLKDFTIMGKRVLKEKNL